MALKILRDSRRDDQVTPKESQDSPGLVGVDDRQGLFLPLISTNFLLYILSVFPTAEFTCVVHSDKYQKLLAGCGSGSENDEVETCRPAPPLS